MPEAKESLLSDPRMITKGVVLLLLLIITVGITVEGQEEEVSTFKAAVDGTVELSSGATQASRSPICVQSLKELMIRGSIPATAHELRNNLTDAQLVRIGLLASIALISPWDQNPDTGRFFISEKGGVLVEAFHPSTSESDIMLCVVCSLLAIIVMFHVTNAQKHFVQSGAIPEGSLLSPAQGSGSSKGH